MATVVGTWTPTVAADVQGPAAAQAEVMQSPMEAEAVQGTDGAGAAGVWDLVAASQAVC